LEFPETPFFLYKLTQQGTKNLTDWVNSVYMNISVTNITINNWKYDNVSPETGIMLVESIQNFKTYFSNISFDAEFKVNVNFTRMSCDLELCPFDPRDKGVYNGTLSLSKLNMSLS
jgi:hypothetical protein